MEISFESCSGPNEEISNKKRKASNVQVGDMVYLKIHPHRLQSMPTKIHLKLSSRYYEPYSFQWDHLFNQFFMYPS